MKRRRVSGPVVLPLSSRRVFAAAAVDWGRVGVGVLVLGLLVAVLALPLAARAQSSCSGLYARTDGAYSGWPVSAGAGGPALSVAERDAALQAWCSPGIGCVITSSAHTAGTFAYTYFVDSSNNGGPFTFIDQAGADCSNPNFGGGGGASSPAMNWGDPAHVGQVILFALALGFGLHGYSVGSRS